MYVIKQLLCCCFLHFYVGKKFFPCIFQACTEKVNRVINNKKAVVVVLTGMNRYR